MFRDSEDFYQRQKSLEEQLQALGSGQVEEPGFFEGYIRRPVGQLFGRTQSLLTEPLLGGTEAYQQAAQELQQMTGRPEGDWEALPGLGDVLATQLPEGARHGVFIEPVTRFAGNVVGDPTNWTPAILGKAATKLAGPAIQAGRVSKAHEAALALQPAMEAGLGVDALHEAALAANPAMSAFTGLEQALRSANPAVRYRAGRTLAEASGDVSKAATFDRLTKLGLGLDAAMMGSAVVAFGPDIFKASGQAFQQAWGKFEEGELGQAAAVGTTGLLMAGLGGLMAKGVMDVGQAGRVLYGHVAQNDPAAAAKLAQNAGESQAADFEEWFPGTDWTMLPKEGEVLPPWETPTAPAGRQIEAPPVEGEVLGWEEWWGDTPPGPPPGPRAPQLYPPGIPAPQTIEEAAALQAGRIPRQLPDPQVVEPISVEPTSPVVEPVPVAAEPAPQAPVPEPTPAEPPVVEPPAEPVVAAPEDVPPPPEAGPVPDFEPDKLGEWFGVRVEKFDPADPANYPTVHARLQKVLDGVNAEREKRGEPPLAGIHELDRADVNETTVPNDPVLGSLPRHTLHKSLGGVKRDWRVEQARLEAERVAQLKQQAASDASEELTGSQKARLKSEEARQEAEDIAARMNERARQRWLEQRGKTNIQLLPLDDPKKTLLDVTDAVAYVAARMKQGGYTIEAALRDVIERWPAWKDYITEYIEDIWRAAKREFNPTYGRTIPKEEAQVVLQDYHREALAQFEREKLGGETYTVVDKKTGEFSIAGGGFRDIGDERKEVIQQTVSEVMNSPAFAATPTKEAAMDYLGGAVRRARVGAYRKATERNPEVAATKATKLSTEEGITDVQALDRVLGRSATMRPDMTPEELAAEAEATRRIHGEALDIMRQRRLEEETLTKELGGTKPAKQETTRHQKLLKDMQEAEGDNTPHAMYRYWREGGTDNEGVYEDTLKPSEFPEQVRDRDAAAAKMSLYALSVMRHGEGLSGLARARSMRELAEEYAQEEPAYLKAIPRRGDFNESEISRIKKAYIKKLASTLEVRRGVLEDVNVERTFIPQFKGEINENLGELGGKRRTRTTAEMEGGEEVRLPKPEEQEFNRFNANDAETQLGVMGTPDVVVEYRPAKVGERELGSFPYRNEVLPEGSPEETPVLDQLGRPVYSVEGKKSAPLTRRARAIGYDEGDETVAKQPMAVGRPPASRGVGDKTTVPEFRLRGTNGTWVAVSRGDTPAAARGEMRVGTALVTATEEGFSISPDPATFLQIKAVGSLKGDHTPESIADVLRPVLKANKGRLTTLSVPLGRPILETAYTQGSRYGERGLPRPMREVGAALGSDVPRVAISDAVDRALRILEKEGLITRRGSVGPKVTSPTAPKPVLPKGVTDTGYLLREQVSRLREQAANIRARLSRKLITSDRTRGPIDYVAEAQQARHTYTPGTGKVKTPSGLTEAVGGTPVQHRELPIYPGKLPYSLYTAKLTARLKKIEAEADRLEASLKEEQAPPSPVKDGPRVQQVVLQGRAAWIPEKPAATRGREAAERIGLRREPITLPEVVEGKEKRTPGDTAVYKPATRFYTVGDPDTVGTRQVANMATVADEQLSPAQLRLRRAHDLDAIDAAVTAGRVSVPNVDGVHGEDFLQRVAQAHGRMFPALERVAEEISTKLGLGARLKGIVASPFRMGMVVGEDLRGGQVYLNPLQALYEAKAAKQGYEEAARRTVFTQLLHELSHAYDNATVHGAGFDTRVQDLVKRASEVQADVDRWIAQIADEANWRELEALHDEYRKLVEDATGGRIREGWRGAEEGVGGVRPGPAEGRAAPLPDRSAQAANGAEAGRGVGVRPGAAVPEGAGGAAGAVGEAPAGRPGGERVGAGGRAPGAGRDSEDRRRVATFFRKPGSVEEARKAIDAFHNIRGNRDELMNDATHLASEWMRLLREAMNGGNKAAADEWKKRAESRPNPKAGEMRSRINNVMSDYDDDTKVTIQMWSEITRAHPELRKSFDADQPMNYFDIPELARRIIDVSSPSELEQKWKKGLRLSYAETHALRILGNDVMYKINELEARQADALTAASKLTGPELDKFMVEKVEPIKAELVRENNRLFVTMATINEGSEWGRKGAIRRLKIAASDPQMQDFYQMREGVREMVGARFKNKSERDLIVDKLMAAYREGRFKPDWSTQGAKDWYHLYQKMMKFGAIDKALQFFKAGLLGWPSRFANVSSNTGFVFGLRKLEDALATALEHGTAKVQGKQPERYVQELPLQMAAMRRAMHGGIGEWTKQQKNAFLARPLEFGGAASQDMRHELVQMPSAIGGWWGEFVSFQFKGMNADDALFKHMIKVDQWYKQVYRNVRNNVKGFDMKPGETAVTATERLVDELEKNLKSFYDTQTRLDKRFTDIIESAHKVAARDTFQQELPGWAKGIQQSFYRGGGRAFQVPVPFFKTPFNIAREVLKRTPLGLAWDLPKALAKDGMTRAERMDLASRHLTSAAIGAGLFSMLDPDVLSGSGPMDPEANALKQRTGWRPYSIKIGGEWRSYQRLEPISSLIGMIADAREGLELGDFDRFETGMARVAGSIAENITNKTFLSGLENLSLAMSDPLRYADEWAKRTTASFMPNSIGFVPVGHLATTIDPIYRETEAFTAEPLVAKTPFLSRTLRPQYSPTGEIRERPSTLGPRFLSPFTSSPVKTDPVAQAAQMLADINFPMRRVRPVVDYKGIKVKLDPDEQQELSRAQEEAMKFIGTRLMKDPNFQRLPDNEEMADYPGQRTKKDVIARIVRRYRNPIMAQLRPQLRQRAATHLREERNAGGA